MQNQRENLINIIARCNSKEVKKQWIHEMVSLTDIECAENQCTGCPIETDCIEVCDTTECVADCRIDDNERCGGCRYV